MKRIFTWMTMGMLAAALTLPAQSQGGPGPKAHGDKNKDGICDMTGKHMGQGHGQRKGMQGGQGNCCGKCCRKGGAATEKAPQK